MHKTSIAIAVTLLIAHAAPAAEGDLAAEAAATIEKAVQYLRTEVATGGGYLGSYKIDTDTGEVLDQWGEGHATADQNWIQPPGNPSVGFAFLAAWRATGDMQYLDAAVEVANSLVYGQLECGGWDYIVDHSERGEQRWYYRHNKDADDPELKNGRNQGTFDDNVSQHATRLLIAVEQALLEAAAPRLAGVKADPSGLKIVLVPERYSPANADENQGVIDRWQDAQTGEDVSWTEVLDASQVPFSGNDLAASMRLISHGDLSRPVLQFELKPDRKGAFEKFTADNVGRILAIVYDGECLMAPTIRAPIPGEGVVQMHARPEVVERYGDDYEAIRDAAKYALDYIVRAQNEHGGWPQRFPLSKSGYSRYSTFNDNSIADCTDVMMIAWRTYGDPRYYDAVLDVGQFIIDAQLPEPQPTWAQQYNDDLEPAWARKFEPASATAGESIGVMRTLIKIALFTGDEKYLEPIPDALDWYERSELTGEDEGKWARFYELETNKPLYFTKDYELTYDDSDMPTHYAFKGGWDPSGIERQYNQIKQKGIEAYLVERQEARERTREQKLQRAQNMRDEVSSIIDAQSPVGFWADGNMIEMRTFERNIQTLSQYLELVGDEAAP